MLSPKPNNQIKKLTWKDLDASLQNMFSQNTHDNPSLLIVVDDYEMTADDIKNEAEKNGYTVTIDDSGQTIRFE